MQTKPNTKPWEIHNAEFVTSAVQPSGYPPDGLPQIAFAGRSNVGKSSLLNFLVRRKKLAKTSGTPGHTQLINFFRINGDRFFVDLPGYGYAKAPAREQDKWRRMIDSYLVDNQHLRLLIVLMDARRTPSPLDDQLIAFTEHHNIPAQIVLTKCDKLKRGAMLKTSREIGAHYGFPKDQPPLTTSVTKGTGRDEVLQMLDEIVADSNGELRE